MYFVYEVRAVPVIKFSEDKDDAYFDKETAKPIFYSKRLTLEEALSDVNSLPIENDSVAGYIVVNYDKAKMNQLRDEDEKAEEYQDTAEEYFDSLDKDRYFDRSGFIIDNLAWRGSNDISLGNYEGYDRFDLPDEFTAAYEYNTDVPLGINPEYKPCGDLRAEWRLNKVQEWMKKHDLVEKVKEDQCFELLGWK